MLGEFDGRHSVIGFAVALAIIIGLLWVVGFQDVLAAFSLVRPWAFVAVGAVALVWLLAWSLALRVVLGSLDLEVSVFGAYVLQLAIQFANSVTPFGQAGGEPFSALLISRAIDAEYETGLAAAASADTIHFLPSIAFAIVGLLYYAFEFTLGPRLLRAAAVIAVLIVVVVIGAVLLWRHRTDLEETTVTVIAPLLLSIGRLIPGLRAPGEEAIRRRVRGFYRDVGRVATQPDRLALALGFSAAGWFCLIVCLWLSLFALGHVVAIAALLVVIPLGAVAAAAPLPGGLGGIEAVLILLLVPTTGVSAGVAGAAVLVHRTAVYWFPLVLGGIAIAGLGSGLRFDA